MSTSTDLADFSACYPDGTPEGFPVELFTPIEAGSLFIREAALRKKIDALQDELAKVPQVETPMTSTFAGGVCSRELFIPKGTLLIGKVHLTDHFNICLKGDLTFVTVDGPKRVVGPTMFVAPAGTKKMAYANEDSIWINMHPALTDDPDQIADALTVDKFADFDRLMSKADLEHKMSVYGYTPERMHELSVDPSTLDDAPLKGVEVKPSEIHGQGLFATQDYAAGAVICKTVRGEKRTLAGRYSNHSPIPNAVAANTNDDWAFVALHDIAVGDEITTDYGETIAIITGKKELV